MTQPSHTATPTTGDLLTMRASASDQLPLGARLPAPWPAILVVLVLAAVVGVLARSEAPVRPGAGIEPVAAVAVDEGVPAVAAGWDQGSDAER